MAKGRTRNRRELRDQYEAAEAREREAKVDTDDEDEDVGALEEDTDSEVEEGEEEVAPVKKKKAKKATEPKPRKKTAKTVRKRMVWVVYDNSYKQVARYDFTKKAEADARAEQLRTEKKQTYFVQPLKEEIQE
jgi:hypothetical protein